MADFPTLSREPNRSNFVQSLIQDPTLVSEFENGYQIVRSKYSNVALKFEMTYSFLTNNDKDLLEEFEKDRSYKVGEFNWINPSDLKTYLVRFDENLKFTQETAEDFWNVKMVLVEIRPNTSDVS
jgi:hypothetical protein